MSGYSPVEAQVLGRMLEIAEDVLAESPQEIRVGVNLRSEYDEYRRRVMAEPMADPMQPNNRPSPDGGDKR
jgi:hypothetical protein